MSMNTDLLWLEWTSDMRFGEYEVDITNYSRLFQGMLRILRNHPMKALERTPMALMPDWDIDTSALVTMQCEITVRAHAYAFAAG